jgi:hypothetical protein
MDRKTTSYFTPFFVKVLSYLLASYIAYGITGKRTLRVDMKNVYDAEILKAPAHDANESQAGPERDVDWHRARL